MKKIMLFLLFIFSSTLSFADDTNDQLIIKVHKAEKKIQILKRQEKRSNRIISDLKLHVGTISEKLDNLEKKQNNLDASFNKFSQETKQKTKAIQQTISNSKYFYFCIAISLLLLLCSVYWYFYKRTDDSQKSLSAQIQSILRGLESTNENMAKSYTEIADSLFIILSTLKTLTLNHSLPLQVANEIFRMRKRLLALPNDTIGRTPLQKSLERLEEELNLQGYKIIDHTGMPFTENLNVKPRFINSDDLTSEEKIITNVTEPQVNYKGVMISIATIEVSIGS